MLSILQTKLQAAGSSPHIVKVVCASELSMRNLEATSQSLLPVGSPHIVQVVHCSEILTHRSPAAGHRQSRLQGSGLDSVEEVHACSTQQQANAGYQVAASTSWQPAGPAQCHGLHDTWRASMPACFSRATQPAQCRGRQRKHASHAPTPSSRQEPDIEWQPAQCRARPSQRAFNATTGMCTEALFKP